MPTASRTARCSAAECSNQFGRPNEYSYSRLTPAGAYQLARSQPSSSPKTAPAAVTRSCSGLRRSPRTLARCW